jgi:threonyl-tRNA synthetase
MIDLIFPDGSARQYADGSTGRDVAASISKSLEKKALLIKLDGAAAGPGSSADGRSAGRRQ